MAKEQKGFEWLGQKELDEKAKRITEGLQWSGQKESKPIQFEWYKPNK